MTISAAPADVPVVTREQIRDGLRRLGLKAGDVVVAHSSLKAFGRVDGGADAVIDALLDVVGPDGTLILPSHTNIETFDVAGYDPLSTPVRKNIGIIPETFWRRRDVVRGRHPPRHPWAAKGARAVELIALSESMQIETQHTGGLLNRVADLGGYVLQLGCMHNSNTSVHTGQALAVSEVEGVIKAKADFMTDFDEIDPLLKAAGVMRVGRIGNAEVRLTKSRDLFAVIKDLYVRKYRGAPFLVETAYIPEPDPLSCVEYQGTLRALQVLERVYEEVLESARIGTGAGEIEAAFAKAFDRYGGALVGEGVAAIARQAPLRGGQWWTLDGVIRLDGCHAALGRRVYAGRATRTLETAFRRALDRQEQVAAAIEPGKPLKELFGALAGGEPFEVHRIGRRPKMAPAWGLGEPGEGVFQAGHVVCIGVKPDEAGFARDLYRVDKRGATRLSPVPRGIRTIG